MDYNLLQERVRVVNGLRMEHRSQISSQSTLPFQHGMYPHGSEPQIGKLLIVKASLSGRDSYYSWPAAGANMQVQNF